MRKGLILLVTLAAVSGCNSAPSFDVVSEVETGVISFLTLKIKNASGSDCTNAELVLDLTRRERLGGSRNPWKFGGKNDPHIASGALVQVEFFGTGPISMLEINCDEGSWKGQITTETRTPAKHRR